MKRFDYRRKYSNWNKEKIQKHLPILKEKLIKNIGICDSISDDCLKRISYLESKINNQ